MAKMKDFGTWRVIVKKKDVSSDDLVASFYDLDTTFNKVDYPNGQKVADYYVSTLLSDKYGESLFSMAINRHDFCLNAEVPTWTINNRSLMDIGIFLAQCTSFKEENTSIEVPVANGKIVVERNTDPDYDGVNVRFVTDAENVIDLVNIECPSETGKAVTNIYTYEDICNEDWTRKFSIRVEKIDDVFED